MITILREQKEHAASSGYRGWAEIWLDLTIRYLIHYRDSNIG